tara:strand:- start:629 stop:1222 length:594 start_codon:yes stop_codon:yes gene_type:complete
MNTLITDQGFETYIKYLALKKHFTSDGYDYHKYNGKVRASMDKFRTRNDAYSFAKLSKKDDVVNFMLANFINNQNIWIRQLLDYEAENRYNDWRKKIESLTYTFKSELKNLDEDWTANFVSRDGQHPYIMTQYSQKKISLETFTILTHTANIFEYWSEKIVDKIISRDIIRLSRKYKPFLVYDERKFKDIIRDHFQL